MQVYDVFSAFFAAPLGLPLITFNYQKLFSSFVLGCVQVCVADVLHSWRI